MRERSRNSLSQFEDIKGPDLCKCWLHALVVYQRSKHGWFRPTAFLSPLSFSSPIGDFSSLSRNNPSRSAVMALKIPLLLYGTAWKEERTAHLTETAVLKGFTCIDTANYPTAYNEKLTGDGIAAALKSGVKRRDLFVRAFSSPVSLVSDFDRFTHTSCLDLNKIRASLGSPSALSAFPTSSCHRSRRCMPTQRLSPSSFRTASTKRRALTLACENFAQREV